jgi:hypothetical protein
MFTGVALAVIVAVVQPTNFLPFKFRDFSIFTFISLASPELMVPLCIF